MSNENLTWQEVCRELLRLDAEGHKEPWNEVQFWSEVANDWLAFGNLPSLLAATQHDEGPIRLKPRTVRVTTHSGEALELPEPWWDVPNMEMFWATREDGLADWFVNNAWPENNRRIRTGNAFRTESDAQAWADAMPKIRGAK